MTIVYIENALLTLVAVLLVVNIVLINRARRAGLEALKRIKASQERANADRP
jgi:hypothetical protein